MNSKSFENSIFFPLSLVQTYLVEIQGLHWNVTIYSLYLSHLMWIFMCFAAEVLIQVAAKVLFSVLPKVWLHHNIWKIQILKRI